MKITYIKIRNFKSIRDIEICDIENALILVGKNSTGKTSIIDALLLTAGKTQVEDYQYRDANTSIEVSLHIEFSTEDLEYFHKKGTLNKLRDYDAWYQEFCTKLPSG